MTELRELFVTHGVRDISGLADLSNLESLTVRAPVTNESFAHVAKLVNLRRLSFTESRHVRDLEPLGGLSRLEELYLTGARLVTDIAPIRSLASLRKLDLGDFRSTLRSFAPLRGCQALQWLHALGTRVEDKDLTMFRSMTNLSYLRVEAYSETQKADLEKAFAGRDVRISFDDPKSYLVRGLIRVIKPAPAVGIDYFSIDQDLVGLLRSGDQGTAETWIERRFSKEHPDMARQIEYDSEGSAFVARCETETPIVALAETIDAIIKSRATSGRWKPED